MSCTFLNIKKFQYIFPLESEAIKVDLSSTNPSSETNSTSVSVFAKPDLGARPKIPSYPQNRRPAGGLSRPLPSPGNQNQFNKVALHICIVFTKFI